MRWQRFAAPQSVAAERLTGLARRTTNPGCINAGNRPGATDDRRRYLKNSDMKGHKYFGRDVIAGTVDWAWAHKRADGWNVMCADSAVEFSSNPEVTRQMADINWKAGPSPKGLDNMFDLLELGQ